MPPLQGLKKEIPIQSNLPPSSSHSSTPAKSSASAESSAHAKSSAKTKGAIRIGLIWSIGCVWAIIASIRWCITRSVRSARRICPSKGGSSLSIIRVTESPGSTGHRTHSSGSGSIKSWHIYHLLLSITNNLDAVSKTGEPLPFHVGTAIVAVGSLVFPLFFFQILYPG